MLNQNQNEIPGPEPEHPSSHTKLPSSGERTLRYEDEPPKQAPDKRIHPRRELPLIPERRPTQEQNG